MSMSSKRLLWVDDEIDLLRPHLLLMQERGYHVDAVANGDDALELVRVHPFDLVLLDEQMPGRSGMDVLDALRRYDPHVPVVMVTKSDEDRTLTEAIGRQVAEYLVKPTSPRQVLSVVTRLLEGGAILQQHVAREFSARYRVLSAEPAPADWREWAERYSELVDWELRLQEAGETALLAALETHLDEFRRGFCRWVADRYPTWLRGAPDRPPLSHDLVQSFLAPLLGDGRSAFFVIIDCLRLDQWRTLLPLLAPYAEVEEAPYFSILPTATPYSRNAIFAGMVPREIARRHPDLWQEEGDTDGGLNAHERPLLEAQLRRLVPGGVPVHYERIFRRSEGNQLLQRLPGYLAEPAVTAAVFYFVDLLTHGRSESEILLEVARDKEALRSLTRQWFERSSALQAIRAALSRGVPVLVTTDHGSIHCQRPLTIFAGRDATLNLRYKAARHLRVEDETMALVTEPEALGLPSGAPGTRVAVALEDAFLVYPTKLREYQARYRGSFLHGGISPEEMILPVALLTPR
jgi:DNA-binding response OmpR family regulator